MGNTMNLFGRRDICTAAGRITYENVVRELGKALSIHNKNAEEIDYLYRYMRGDQPILRRTKTVRPEINNKIVENHASEIAQFTSSYFLGEPVTYVHRGENKGNADDLRLLNDFMYFENKSTHDKEMATWMAVCGVGYRMVLPDRNLFTDDTDEAPFDIDTPDPRKTFVVYDSGFGHKRLMGVQVKRIEASGGKEETRYCGYTSTHYFEIAHGEILRWEEHYLGDVPIFEYKLNMFRLGSFEPAVSVLNAINNASSNRMDAIESFVQSFLKFKNCDIDEKGIDSLARLGAIKIKSTDGLDADVELISQELNQTQTQTYVDYLYEQLLTICGLPSTTKGGASTSDTGQAVFLRDGWQQCEARAKDTEQLFKKSERDFLRMVLRIMRITNNISLTLSEVECKFTRRQHDNLLTKTQSLLQMLEAGLKPEIAIATCGLFNDPMDVAAQSKEYLTRWEPQERVPDESVSIPAEENLPNNTQGTREGA